MIMPRVASSVGTSSLPSLSANSAKKRICSAVMAMSPATSWPTGRVEHSASILASVSASASIRSAQAWSAFVRSRGRTPPQLLDFSAA
jgi:hypothetical protein